MPKVTQNGPSLQMILPKEICQTANIRAGDEYGITAFGDTITLRPKTRPLAVHDENDPDPVIFTVGYEGRTIEKFINRLMNHGIEQVIDVREVPLSRKKGFSKSTLRENLESVGIRYIHMPELGSPSDIRNRYRNGGSEEQFFADYENYVEENRKSDVKLMEHYAHGHASALMCFEMSYVHCHRKILAEKLSLKGYRVVHI